MTYNNKKRNINTLYNQYDNNGTFTSIGCLDQNMIISIESKDE
jgi:hypothetical protein